MRVSFIPGINIISRPRGPYLPDAWEVTGGPKAGVALTPLPYMILSMREASEVAHVEAPESKII
jgi:hypothetical protein